MAKAKAGKTHTDKHKTTTRGTGKAQRKAVKPTPDPPDPPKPATLKYTTLDRDKKHGADFTYEWKLGAPINSANTKYHVTITTKGWVSKNIVRIQVPELPVVHRQRLHRLVAPQFVGLYKAAHKKGLKDHFISNEGAFFARTITNNKSKLSNHALGTAVDINGAQNPYGGAPAKRGTRGSLRELADYCADFGLYWGGWYQGRKDGMHFEAVLVLSEAELEAACEKHGLTYADVAGTKPVENVPLPTPRPKNLGQ